MKKIIVIVITLLLYSKVNTAQETFWDKKVYEETDIIPAKIEVYYIGSTSFYFLRPIDLMQYTYLSYYPLTAYMFCMKMNEQKISEITVAELKSGFFNGYTKETSWTEVAKVFNLNYIKGFEEDAKFLASMDEFEIAERKEEFKSKLLECWKLYDAEFENRYLKHKYSITPHTKSYAFDQGKPLLEYKSGDYIPSRSALITLFFNSQKDDYDFDNQYLNLDYPFFNQSSFPFTDITLKEKKYLTFKKVYLPLGVIKTYKLNQHERFSYVYTFIVSPTREFSKTNYLGAHYYSYCEFDINSIDLIFTGIIGPYKVEEYRESFLYPQEQIYTINLYTKN